MQGGSRVQKGRADMQSHRKDGFVSSVGNKELTQKYGNQTAVPLSPQMEAEKVPQAPLGCTDNVKPEDMVIVKTMNDLVAALENHPNLTNGERRQLADIKKSKDILFSKINSGVLNPDLMAKLHQMIQFFTTRDWRSAQQLNVALTTTDWNEQKDWLRGTKALINISSKRLM